MPRDEIRPAFSDRDRQRAVVASCESRRPKGIDPSGTCTRYYDDDEFEFLMAIEAYKAKHCVRFPTACMYLQILKSLGYRQS